MQRRRQLLLLGISLCGVLGVLGYLALAARQAGWTVTKRTMPMPPLGDGPWTFATAEHPRIRVNVLARGLEHPWAIAFLPDSGMLITERVGRLRMFRDGRLDPRPIAGVPEVWRVQGTGLQDVAVHPRFTENRLIYLTYMRPTGDGMGAPALARARLEGHELHEFEELLITEAYGGPWGPNARVVFGPDGKLYVSTGSGGGMRDAAQEPGSLRGKILRLNDDGSVPPDNPFAERPGWRPEIWSLGHRNTLGLIVHPDTGEVWQHEAGPIGGDEINVILPGRNYGWPLLSFGRFRSGARVSAHPTREGYESPLVVWLPSITPAGMAVYTGDRFPAWRGNVFVGSLRRGGINGTGHMQRIVFNERMEELRRESLLAELRQRIREVRQGPDGLLYVLTDHTEGTLLRLEPR